MTFRSQQAVSYFESLEAKANEGDEVRSDEVSVAGRMVAFRGMGRATFADLLDGEGRIQVLFRRNDFEDSYEILKDFDLGDWVGVSGPIFRTRTGQVTLQAQSFTMRTGR